jgi:hypothetical protein
MSSPWAVCSKYNHHVALHSSDAGFRADIHWWSAKVEGTLTVWGGTRLTTDNGEIGCSRLRRNAASCCYTEIVEATNFHIKVL